MAAELHELTGSGDATVGQSKVDGQGLAVVLGAADYDEARALAESFFPTSIDGIPRGSIGLKDRGGGVFFVDVDYASGVRAQADAATGTDPGAQGSHEGGGNPAGGKDGADALGEDYSFSTKGGTAKIYVSRAVVNSYAIAGRAASDPKNRIGSSAKGNTEGLDIIAPSPEFTISRKLSQVTLGYFLRLIAATGTINDDSWKGLGQFEALFVGADGNFRHGDGWNINWSFRYCPSEFDIEISPDLTVDVKQGWDYIDVRFEEVLDAASNTKILKPFEAHVHRVYRDEDFGLLDLGD